MAIRYLTMEDRERIGEMYESGARVIDIAYRVGCHLSTVYEELKRGEVTDETGTVLLDRNQRAKYSPVCAQRRTVEAIHRRGNRRGGNRAGKRGADTGGRCGL